MGGLYEDPLWGCGDETPVKVSELLTTPILPDSDPSQCGLSHPRDEITTRVRHRGTESPNESLLTNVSTGMAHRTIEDRIDGKSCT